MITYRDGIGYETNDTGELTYEVDDGTMPENVEALRDSVVGHRIVEVNDAAPTRPPGGWSWDTPALDLVLDDGTIVRLANTDDCCAFTSLEKVIRHLPTMDHIITNVTADEDFTRWHILADFGEVLELEVGWSSGNPFYYGYGFNITVEAPA